MKLKTLLLIVLFIIPSLIQAQSEQLQREIRIAEGILQELFQENLKNEFPFIAFSSNRITSDYIPGYGVHFMLGNSLGTTSVTVAPSIQIVQSGNNRTVVRGVDNVDQNSEGEDDRLTIDELEMRMTEYFTQYASLLRNLPDNEQIRLSTGLNSQISRVFITIDQGNRNFNFPRITKWVSKSDVLAFESGRINESQFTQRIQSADLTEVSDQRDFNIFKSILSTSLQETGFEKLNIRSASSYTYLPGFGIQFNVNAGTRGGPFNAFFSNIAGASDMDFNVNVDVRGNIESEDRETMRKELDSIRLESRRTLDSLEVAIADFAEVAVSFRDAFIEEREPIDPEILENDKELLYDEIERAIRDYGNTLSSLPDDEFIIVAVNWSTRESTLPERTYIRLKKNELSSRNALEIQEVTRN